MCAASQSVCPSSAVKSFVRSDSVVCRNIAGETLVVPIRGKVGDLAFIYSFNETGSLLWTALEHPKSLQDLAYLLQDSFEVTWDDAERDVKAFIEQIQAAGLIAPVEH
jgi:Coenzyme PQQ synthesis protein D (PqqD)